jgi:hypothetical protein
LSHLYFRYVAFYCRSLLAPLQTHPCAPARAILPAIPGVAAHVASKQPEIVHHTRASLTNRQLWDSPNVLCVRGVFPASSYSHAVTLSVGTSLFLPSLSSTASDREAAPCGAAAFCFASAPVQVLVPPPLRAPSKKADLGTWEQPHARALRVVCLERLRASREKLRCLYMLSGIGLAWFARQRFNH